MTAQRGDEVPAPKPGSRRRKWAGRVALALASAALTFLLLEAVARVVLPVPAPQHYRDGIYLSTLPLVNGRPGMRGEWSDEGAPLAEAKAEGELRVFVFGESSVEGCPWGQVASPPTMIHDQLAEALPGRKVTVVNMGRTSSFTMDTFYYLLTIGPYAPDVVVFYLGINERYGRDLEMCLPATHPTLHAVWRWLVARSRLLWAARTLAPERFGGRWESTGGDEGQEQACVAVEAFQGWTDILVGTARGLGAEVVVASPVAGASMHVDWAFHDAAFGRQVWEAPDADATGGGRPAPRSPFDELAAALGAVSDASRALLLCQLDVACDPAGPLEQQLLGLPDPADSEEGPDPWVRAPADGQPAPARPGRPRPIAAGTDTGGVLARGDAWRSSAERLGARYVDFFGLLAAASPRGVLQAPLVVDEVHLSPEGYWFLASVCSAEILGVLGVEAPGGRAAVTAPGEAPDRYREGEEEALLKHALFYLRKRMPFLASSLLRMAVERHDSQRGRVLQGWMREALGAPAGLVGELAGELEALDVDALCRQTPGCR